MTDADEVLAELDPQPAVEALPVSRRATLQALAGVGALGTVGSAQAQEAAGGVVADEAYFTNYGWEPSDDGGTLTIDGDEYTFDGSDEIELPDGSTATEVVLPGGATASEVIGPDGEVLWERLGLPNTELTEIANHVWFMDEKSGDSIKDQVGSKDGTINGPSWFQGRGKGDAYLEYDNKNDETAVGDVLGGNPDEFTICAWGEIDKTRNCDLIDQDDGEARLWYYETFDSFEARVADEPVGDGYEEPTDGEWHMACLTFSSGDVNIYIYEAGEGQVHSTSASVSDPDFTNDHAFTFGNTEGRDRGWQGGVDYGVVSYTEATESEVTDHYDKTVELY